MYLQRRKAAGCTHVETKRHRNPIERGVPFEYTLSGMTTPHDLEIENDVIKSIWEGKLRKK
jgi:hypothetical protein